MGEAGQHVGGAGRTLCREMPRSTTWEFLSRLMLSYISASINQKAMVLSPTSACALSDVSGAEHATSHRKNGSVAELNIKKRKETQA